MENNISSKGIVPKPPLLVRIIALIAFVEAIFYSIGILLVGDSMLLRHSFITAVSIRSLIKLVIFASIVYIISIGLYKIKNWARIFTIILGVANVAIFIFTFRTAHLVTVIVTLWNLVVILYLFFNKKVKEVFTYKVPNKN